MQKFSHPREIEIRKHIIEIGRRLWQRGYVSSNDGNISALTVDNLVITTPTGISKGFMQDADLVKIDLKGNVLDTKKKPSSEILMHLAIYEVRPEIKAVVHAHPPITTGFSVAGQPLDKCVLAEVILSLGSIPIAEYATPSTKELADKAKKYFSQANHDALMLANHGAVTVGQDLFTAYYKMETLEHFAKISLVARMLGGERFLPPEKVQELYELRSKFGLPTTAPQCLTCPSNPNKDQLEADFQTSEKICQVEKGIKNSDRSPQSAEDLINSILEEYKAKQN